MKLRNLHILIKQESITSQKHCSQDFWRIANGVLKVNLLYLLYSTARKCFPLDLIKQNYLLKTFLRTLILITEVPYFPSRTSLKLHNISVTSKMVKNIITNLNSSKASSPDCILVVVLTKCEPDLSFILTELFSKFLKASCFPDCLKVSWVIPVFKNIEYWGKVCRQKLPPS